MLFDPWGDPMQQFSKHLWINTKECPEIAFSLPIQLCHECVVLAKDSTTLDPRSDQPAPLPSFVSILQLLMDKGKQDDIMAPFCFFELQTQMNQPQASRGYHRHCVALLYVFVLWFYWHTGGLWNMTDSCLIYIDPSSNAKCTHGTRAGPVRDTQGHVGICEWSYACFPARKGAVIHSYFYWPIPPSFWVALSVCVSSSCLRVNTQTIGLNKLAEPAPELTYG